MYIGQALSKALNYHPSVFSIRVTYDHGVGAVHGDHDFPGGVTYHSMTLQRGEYINRVTGHISELTFGAGFKRWEVARLAFYTNQGRYLRAYGRDEATNHQVSRI